MHIHGAIRAGGHVLTNEEVSCTGPPMPPPGAPPGSPSAPSTPLTRPSRVLVHPARLVDGVVLAAELAFLQPGVPDSLILNQIPEEVTR